MPEEQLKPAIPNTILNIEKTDYGSSELFLGQAPGLLDTINKPHPEIWALYKKMKFLDWDENDFDYSTCNQEFKTCSKSMYQAMIYNLAYQWEADTIASRSIAPILAPFITSSELWAATMAISTNELLHSATYSEIVRNSFDNPDDVLSEILAVTESFQRLEFMAQIFTNVYTVSHRYALNEATKDQAYDALMKFYVALYCLERIQFIASFAVTFAFGEIGMFVPIAKSVQKICQDEFEVHAVLDKLVLQYELKTPRGIAWMQKNSTFVATIVTSMVNSELTWSDFLGSEDRELPGMTSQKLRDFVLFNSQVVYANLGLTNPFNHIATNPLPFTKEWMNINAIQAAPQEEKGRNSAYLIGAIQPRNKDKVYDMDGL